MKKPNNFTNTVQYPVRDHYHNEQSWQDVRLAYDRIYDLQHEVRGLHSKLNEPKIPEKQSLSTKINGLNVKGVPPQHGQSPTYNAGSGEYELNTAAGGVAPPATHTSKGIPGQIAFDSGFVYVCVGVNSWMRAALSTFP